jgi:arylsulfatase A-like enzyme
VWDETNVLFSSDHGEEFGEHGLYFHRNFPYDELINVPLIVRPADESPPARVDDQRELLDIAPTVCAMHGVDDSDAGFLGTPLYEGGSRDVVALGQPGMDVPAVSVRADGWKYVHTEDSSQLYDLEADPDEQRDVHDENPRVAARLRRTIPDRLFGRDTKSPRPPENEVGKEQLEALGYMELRESDGT